MSRLAAGIAFVAFVDALSTNTFRLHQPVNPVLTAWIIKILQIQGDVPVAIHATAFEPSMFYQTNQSASEK
jgi:hypothetical protein